MSIGLTIIAIATTPELITFKTQLIFSISSLFFYYLLNIFICFIFKSCLILKVLPLISDVSGEISSNLLFY